MPHVHRFYVPRKNVSAAEIALPPEGSHHALHVVRVQVGGRVVLFDGEGTELEGEVSRATRRIEPKSRLRLPRASSCMNGANSARAASESSWVEAAREDAPPPRALTLPEDYSARRALRAYCFFCTRSDKLSA